MTTLGEQLDGAKIVKHDPDAELTLAWFGGHGIHAYSANGVEVAYWNVGSCGENDARLDDVEASMANVIETQDYASRC